MRVGMRIALSLALFLAIAGAVYATTAYDWRISGTVLLVVCAVSALYVGLVFRRAVRRASVPITKEAPPPEEPSAGPAEAHVGPTIWPFVFSIAALLLVVGIVGAHWLLIPGTILFIGAGTGWFLDIKRQWHPGNRAAAHEQASATSVSTLQGKQQPDQDDRS